MEHYVAFVHEARERPVCGANCSQIYLAPPAFIEKMQALVDKKPFPTEIPRAQRRATERALTEFAGAHERNDAIARAYLSGTIRWALLRIILRALHHRESVGEGL